MLKVTIATPSVRAKAGNTRTSVTGKVVCACAEKCEAAVERSESGLRKYKVRGVSTVHGLFLLEREEEYKYTNIQTTVGE